MREGREMRTRRLGKVAAAAMFVVLLAAGRQQSETGDDRQRQGQGERDLAGPAFRRATGLALKQSAAHPASGRALIHSRSTGRADLHGSWRGR